MCDTAGRRTVALIALDHDQLTGNRRPGTPRRRNATFV
jgi:hypothetical protein